MIGGKENPFDPCGFCRQNGMVEYELGTNQVSSCPFTEAIDSIAARTDIDSLKIQEHTMRLRELHLSWDKKAVEYREKTGLDFSGCPKIDYQPLRLVLTKDL